MTAELRDFKRFLKRERVAVHCAVTAVTTPNGALWRLDVRRLGASTTFQVYAPPGPGPGAAALFLSVVMNSLGAADSGLSAEQCGGLRDRLAAALGPTWPRLLMRIEPNAAPPPAEPPAANEAGAGEEPSAGDALDELESDDFAAEEAAETAALDAAEARAEADDDLAEYNASCNRAADAVQDAIEAAETTPPEEENP